MEENRPLALPRAAVAAVAALVRRVRERAVPVAKAVGRAGAAVGGASVAGGRGIVDAAKHGEARAEAQREEERQEAKRAAPATRTRRRSPTATAG